MGECFINTSKLCQNLLNIFDKSPVRAVLRRCRQCRAGLWLSLCLQQFLVKFHYSLTGTGQSCSEVIPKGREQFRFSSCSMFVAVRNQSSECNQSEFHLCESQRIQINSISLRGCFRLTGLTIETLRCKGYLLGMTKERM